MPTPAILRRLPLLLLGLAWALAVPAGAEDHAALGREALARADYRGAAEHLEAASRALEGGDREKLSQVQIDLGVTYLTGLSRPDDALRAFVRAADLAAHPASAWLWASTAAEALGQAPEAARYRALALGRKPAPPAVAEPAPAPAPVVEPEPASQPEPASEPEPNAKPAVAEAEPAQEPQAAPESEKPSAFDHFFGANEKAPVRPAEGKASKEEKKGSADRRDDTRRPKEKKPEADAPAQPAGGAFDHFFKRKPADEPHEPAAAEPPPA